ncbi:NAD(P)H-dependent oxidoreductase [Antarcticibacterium sp. 1MA-6-2]|uniref:NAD(P)H-dependent oxidoreductase n=1 Tax=Antarcticibacterium sp. 1MA-6-2 TaxID=2908210 RepID=UPI001F3A9C8E|nr:NAD(P)H-dependent oxidoreductase [Antarcticibacterium sp. 1MA-6-2]UJH91135.1 NAD(P)H-dependent oxidoreductase [Antarcticibacterium sp. 1MA-6-2]
MNNYIDALNWRYATKIFDKNKKVSPGDLEKLMAGIQLSASSYGLQPYEVFIIEDEEIREKLKSVAWNQTQITDASHLIVFASYTEISEKHIEAYLQTISKARNVSMEELAGFRTMLQNTILQQSKEAQAIWTAKQAYIALGNLLSAAANMKIDTCPMEGFNAEEFDNLLNLKEKGLKTTVIAPIGYRSVEDQTQFVPKVRKSKKQLFHLV